MLLPGRHWMVAEDDAERRKRVFPGGAWEQVETPNTKHQITNNGRHSRPYGGQDVC